MQRILECLLLAHAIHLLLPRPYQHIKLPKMGAIVRFNNLNPLMKALSVISLIVAMPIAVFGLTFALGRGAGAGATTIAFEDQKGGRGDSSEDVVDGTFSPTRPTSSPIHSPTRAPTMQLSAVKLSTTKPSTIAPSRPSTALPSKPHMILQPSTEMPCPPLFKKAKPTSIAEPSP